MIGDLSWAPLPTDLPPVITPEGLSYERQSYLYDKIREYCRPQVRDEVCPRPSRAPGSPQARDDSSEDDDDEEQPE